MILVAGAKGVVGQPLVMRLQQDTTPYLAITRSKPSQQNQMQWNMDNPLTNAQRQQLSHITTIIHCAPIWLLPAHLPRLTDTQLKRIIVFSSTSVLSKANSANTQEQRLVARLRTAEQSLMQFCQQQNWHLTILRPSLIYGYGRDQNVYRLASLIRRFGFMLLVGQGTGLRQPVHADDLVTACLTIKSLPVTYNQIYNLVGGETLTYQTMLIKIFQAVQQPVRIIHLPLWAVRSVLWLLTRVTRFNYTPEMANRMNQDLCYDDSKARHDFAYSAQAFLRDAQRDLP